MSYEATFKIVLFADAGVGKRTLVHNFFPFAHKPNYSATGVDFYVKSVSVDNIKVKL